MILRLGCICICLLFFSCNIVEEELVIPVSNGIMEIPIGFPSMEHPADNKFNIPRWELGKRLFYEVNLSSDRSVSCASCHKPNLAFSDDETFSFGVSERIGTRNSPSLANIGYHPYLTREGGVPTLEMQVLVPIQEHNEFDFNILLVAERLKEDPNYVQMSLEAYGREPDAFVITRALACFERSLISGLSPYDLFSNYGREQAISESAKRGLDLFFSSRTNCSSCHSGFNFTNYEFENNGLYEQYSDEGRFRLTLDSSDIALFKVPSLRNIELSAPYMHDGSISTIEEVITHYQNGGKNHTNKSSLISPLDLTNEEQRDLKAFLLSLTDDYFIDNKYFK